MSVLYFLLLVGVLVVIHELGHFAAAKLLDVKVLRFSIGYGRPLIRFKLRETDQPLGKVTFSAGVALGHSPDGTPALQRADALLYAAKNNGRNQVHWETAQAQAA